jgi:nitrogen regulatory protein PII
MNQIALPTEKRTLLTIITEAAIEQALLKELERIGVKGYTVSDARGKGSRGVRDAAWAEAANIRIEIICLRSQADEVLRQLHARYFDNYAMVAFMQDVDVLRPEKF